MAVLDGRGWDGLGVEGEVVVDWEDGWRRGWGEVKQRVVDVGRGEVGWGVLEVGMNRRWEEVLEEMFTEGLLVGR
ncbi:hypothetical protein, partial [Micrococcus luteus]|uniref:hypothetical protein n=1 Tax=Micrococcus luteus TaxID=1270 RepID=UPI001C930C37